MVIRVYQLMHLFTPMCATATWEKVGVVFLLRSKSSKLDETRLWDQFLLSMKVNGAYALCFAERPFPTFLKGIIFKHFTGDKPPDPHFGAHLLMERLFPQIGQCL